MLAKFFQIGKGNVELYTNRCIMAIISIQDQFLTWPNADEHQDFAEGFEAQGFTGCIGAIDGTLMILQNRPERDGPNYYNCKGSYGIATLFVCDSNKKIQYFSTGWPWMFSQPMPHDQLWIDQIT